MSYLDEILPHVISFRLQPNGHEYCSNDCHRADFGSNREADLNRRSFLVENFYLSSSFFRRLVFHVLPKLMAFVVYASTNSQTQLTHEDLLVIIG